MSSHVRQSPVSSLTTLSRRQGLLLNPKFTPSASQVSLGSQFVPGILSLPLKCCDYRCAPTAAWHLNGYLGSKFYSSCLQACAANVQPLMRQPSISSYVAQGQEKQSLCLAYVGPGFKLHMIFLVHAFSVDRKTFTYFKKSTWHFLNCHNLVGISITVSIMLHNVFTQSINTTRECAKNSLRRCRSHD